ncbi:dual OB domain-containing protein [Stenotrophomonas maltophilia]|uniref:dual OB domain-containing protein n=1 Tax=Stenotrophomonas maltophilia TaxID=40324 RepID=UPI0015DE9467|nr:hypothetical protein [Stenotrophomonas maltophilia]MDZ5813703.1 hypothetical protein [Stenotrophomonas maltophilia]
MQRIDDFYCLANSKKHSGRCIAGKIRLNSGDWVWIRPVGTTEGKEITEQDRVYESGKTAQVFDVINIAVLKKDNHQFQKENVVIDNRHYWIKESTFDKSILKTLEDRPSTLWENGDSSYSGLNDRVDINILTHQRETLYLIQPQDLEFTVLAEGASFGDHKRSIRAHFNFNGTKYALKVTDPSIIERHLSMENGRYKDASVTHLTISLGEPYKGHAYKLVAAAL